ncbi:pneumococcal-type histidine triad protein [Streptococcus iniae]|nr:hypothetical protein BKX95_07170 [Streptococcus iniae]RLV28560.1 pneumococcal-type histidine triad protein [Streptococcus iniae]
MKKTVAYLTGVLVVVLVLVGLFSFCQVGKQDSNAGKKQRSVAYIDSKASQSQAKLSGAKTMDQINAEEGISAEQIVVKITDQGYVTSHGDHFHFYNGKVPYDAIVSEELLMTDPNYQFKQSDVISEMSEAAIIKVDDSYAVYVFPDSSRKNIRTKAEIAKEVAKANK